MAVPSVAAATEGRGHAPRGEGGQFPRSIPRREPDRTMEAQMMPAELKENSLIPSSNSVDIRCGEVSGDRRGGA